MSILKLIVYFEIPCKENCKQNISIKYFNSMYFRIYLCFRIIIYVFQIILFLCCTGKPLRILFAGVLKFLKFRTTNGRKNYRICGNPDCMILFNIIYVLFCNIFRQDFENSYKIYKKGQKQLMSESEIKKFHIEICYFISSNLFQVQSY